MSEDKKSAKAKKSKNTEKSDEVKDTSKAKRAAVPTVAEQDNAGDTSKSPSKEPKATQSASEETENTTTGKVKPVAKAGKRSEKALKEGEAKAAKEERKTIAAAQESEATDKPKIQQKPARSKLERKSPKFRKLAELIEKDKTYSTKEALELAVKTSPVKFDATVELHVRLGVDPRQADQNIRDMVVLPAGTGKTIRVAVLADPDGIIASKKAGADIASGDEFLQELEKGVINFDILIATPAFMPKLGKYARVLGPKGLMPNPKSGTVTNDVAKAVKDAKAGRVEYRVDSTGIVHTGIGKVSFGAEKLLQNANAILNSLKHNKPSSVKGSYVRSIYLTTSMGPSIPVSTSEI